MKFEISSKQCDFKLPSSCNQNPGFKVFLPTMWTCKPFSWTPIEFVSLLFTASPMLESMALQEICIVEACICLLPPCAQYRAPGQPVIATHACAQNERRLIWLRGHSSDLPAVARAGGHGKMEVAYINEPSGSDWGMPKQESKDWVRFAQKRRPSNTERVMWRGIVAQKGRETSSVRHICITVDLEENGSNPVERAHRRGNVKNHNSLSASVVRK